MAGGDNSFYRCCFILWLLILMPLFHCAPTAVIRGSSNETYERQSDLECDKGQHILFQPGNSDKETCLPCPSNTFMNWANHRQPRCLSCTPDPVYPETVLHSCTKTSDAVLGCADGYYIQVTHLRTGQKQCAVCHNCSYDRPPRFEGRPCGGHSDTVCCPKSGMKAVTVNWPGGFHCRDLCPPGKYSLLIHDRDPNSFQCMHCRICSYTTRPYQTLPCSEDRDTVCCPQAGMMAVYMGETKTYDCRWPSGTDGNINGATNRHINGATNRHINGASHATSTSATKVTKSETVMQHGNEYVARLDVIVLTASIFLVGSIIGLMLSCMPKRMVTSCRPGTRRPKIQHAKRAC